MTQRYSIVMQEGKPELVPDPKGEYVALMEYLKILVELEQCEQKLRQSQRLLYGYDRGLEE